MDIIINPTNRCNFACTFCAASNLVSKDITIEDTIKHIDPYKDKLGQIIINGGDPLMMNPEYYWELLKYINTLDHYVTISLTTNLWDFYQNPSKWKDLFKQRQIGVITSFQYGNKRRLRNQAVYDEELFLKVMICFKSHIGYKPNFISVIDYDNEDSILRTCKLAKDTRVECKINKVIVSGRNSSYYPRYRIFEKYIDIMNNGLGDYEMNCNLLNRFFRGLSTYCDLDRDCYKHIRCVNPDGIVTTCSYTAENYYKSGFKYNIDDKRNNPNKFALDYNYIKADCMECEHFKLCNSCRVYVKEVRDNHDEDNYCDNMKRIIPLLKRSCLG